MHSHHPIHRVGFCALIVAAALLLTRPAGATTNAAFVDKAYQDLLLRSASPSDISTWVGLLDSSLTRPQFALDVMNSDEYRHIRAAEFYTDFLGRSGSGLELNNLTLFLQSATLAQGRASLLGSAEYFSSQGASTNAGFLNSLYLDLLNRPIDSASSTFYLNQLGLGATRSDVALSVQSSDEWRGDIVTSYYQQFLHRAPDATGLAAFKSLLSTGTEQDVIANLIGSQEYFNNVPEPAGISILCLLSLWTMRRKFFSNR